MNNLSRREFFKIGAGAGLFAALPFGLRGAESVAPGPASTAAFGVYRFKIGEWDAWSISDGRLTIPNVQSVLATDVEKSLVDAALKREFLPADRLGFSVNILAVRTPQGVVLVDTGAGPMMGPVAGFIKTNLAAVGIKPSDIAAIFISHAHGDHFGGLIDPATGKPNFPNATVYINKVEYDFWTANPFDFSKVPAKPEGWKQFATGNGAAAAKAFAAEGAKMHKVAPGDRILDGFELIAAPGHTPGHLNFLIGSGDDRVLHLVDAAHSVVQMGNPDWALNFDADEALGRVTRKSLFDRLASDRTRSFAYHLGYPGLGHIRRDGAAFSWVAEQ